MKYPIAYSSNGEKIRATIEMDGKKIFGSSGSPYPDMPPDEEFAALDLLRKLTKNGCFYQIDPHPVPQWVEVR